MPLGREVGLNPLPRKGGRAPQFSAHVYCGQTAGWIKMALGMEVGLSPGHNFARWGPSSFSPKRGTDPQFLAHICCGQTARWIKMPLGTKGGLSPGHIVLDGAQLPQKGGTAPNFRPMFIVAKRSPISATAEYL